MIFAKPRTLPYIIAALLLLCQPGYAVAQPVPTLELASGTVSEDGHIRIAWSTKEKRVPVELQQAENENFTDATTVYRGADKATFISGLENGTYYYRIRRVDGAWSAPVKLLVNHHSLQLALVLVSLGAVVFGLTVFIVLKGAFSASVD